ncbi:glycine--tRNA ligase subunit beta [Luteimonas terricola]|uniref:Glycine--tRNA ligase beta subunit n=1 Tax=Luteimonas terricola TaxID=645597 RepID=A0ABQ2E5K9_9GAMM|nr:glycine--tRNA ligase subunit beta [Luteimonas terricola]GGJ95972.1 glycine--tRNA ligase beta subunit [Luteimonas terricola]
MTDTAPLLIELGTDELPVAALPGLARAFLDGVRDALTSRGIGFAEGARPLYGPRRLAVLLDAVATVQPDRPSEVLGPYVNIALDADGQPTRALQGFAQKAGVDWSMLERASDQKGERFVHRSVTPGAATRDLLPAVVEEAIAAIPVPKAMRWGAHAHAFARPVHWLVVLLGDAVVPATAFGIASDRMSRGHRFMHDKPVWIGNPRDYVDALRAAKVLVDPEERRDAIVSGVQAAATAAGGVARIDPGNLAEVECLVEWPAAVACSFEAEFLAVPPEALVATMEANQKFFPVLDADGRLTEHFIGVANIASRDEAEVRKGYERVIRPRFADAKFFFVEDMKQGLSAMNEGLAGVTYQAKLGSVADKAARVATLAGTLAPAAGVDAALAQRAALLSKADLQSRMVNEFPELQGIAGRYYAAQDPALAELAHDDRIALAAALDEAWQPRGAGDAIAPSPLGRVLAIAERIDTLAGGFAAGLKPTGNKDPFALRRAALGLARTVIEGGPGIDLPAALTAATAALPEGVRPLGDPAAALATDLYDFILDRLRGYYADRGVPAQHFSAVAALRPASLADFDQRIAAIASFARLPEAEALAAADKRIRNILRKADAAIPETVDASLLVEPAEQALSTAMEAAWVDAGPALEDGDYVAALARLARLRPEVDAFFDAVMVNAEDLALRNNRLALLQRLARRLGAVAELGQLSV